MQFNFDEKMVSFQIEFELMWIGIEEEEWITDRELGERFRERKREGWCGRLRWRWDLVSCETACLCVLCHVIMYTFTHSHVHIYMLYSFRERKRETQGEKIYIKKFRWKSRFWFIKVCVEIVRKLWKLRVSFSSVNKNIDRNRDWNLNSYLSPYTRVNFAVYLRSTSYIHHLS